MFDLLIKNGTVCDGTGAPAFTADIGITGDKITYIGRELSEAGQQAGQVIDASGLTVTPGFIDPHTHVDQSVLTDPAMEPYLKQGVTTVVTGNCGYGMAPQSDEVFYCSIMDEDFLSLSGADVNEQLSLFFKRDKAEEAFSRRYGVRPDWNTFAQFNERCENLPLGCNMAPLIGYNAVRTSIMGMDCLRTAGEEELQALEYAVRDCMEAGAFGISSGRDPIYLPGPYACDEEMNRMLHIAAEYGGIFASHTYNRNKDGFPDRIGGYEEMVRQARGTGIKLNVSHVHVMNMAESDREAVSAAEQTLDYFRRLSEQGYDLTYDVIPSPACADFTQRSAGYFLKPLVLMSGSRTNLASALRRPEEREKIRKAACGIPTLNEASDTCWLSEFYILHHRNPAYSGKSLQTCAEVLKLPLLDTLLEIFSEDADMIMDMVAPDFSEAVDILCQNDRAMPCSDGSSYAKEVNLTGNPEIPLYPSSMNISYLPRYLLRYGKTNFEKTVHQASGFVAERFAIDRRGLIKEGNFADLVIIDRDKLYSFDEESDPLKDPLGIVCVTVNGRIAATNGRLTGVGSGKVLRKG